MVKTDNRADYEAHLQDHIDHTVVNLREAEDYLEEHEGEMTAAKKHMIETCIPVRIITWSLKAACLLGFS